MIKACDAHVKSSLGTADVEHNKTLVLKSFWNVSIVPARFEADNVPLYRMNGTLAWRNVISIASKVEDQQEKTTLLALLLDSKFSTRAEIFVEGFFRRLEGCLLDVINPLGDGLTGMETLGHGGESP